MSDSGLSLRRYSFVAFLSISAAGLWISFHLASVAVEAASELQDPGEAVSSRINLRMTGSAETHNITVIDIFTLRKIADTEISPDGTRVAFLVTQRFLDSNSQRTALFVANSDRGQTEPILVCERDSIAQVHWSPDGKFLTFRSEAPDGGSKSASSQIWRASPEGGSPELLFQHKAGIAQYQWSPDGTRLAFTATRRPESPTESSDRGVVYDEDDLIPNFKMMMRKDWHLGTNFTQVWVYDVDHLAEQMLYETQTEIYQLRWSPDGAKIAITYLASGTGGGTDNTDIGILSLSDHTLTPVVTWEGEDTNPSWSPDGKRLAFASEGNVRGMAPWPIVDSVFVVNIDSPQSATRVASETGEAKISWDRGGQALRLEVNTLRNGGLYEVPVKGGRMTRISKREDYLSQFSFDSNQTKAAFVIQNLSRPPDVGILDIRTGFSVTLTNLNPQFRKITLGEVSELIWKNKYGNETNGFLIKPIGYTEGRRYPLVLILYGFRREFTTQAQWIPNYPAQVFAARGFAVLLVNYPKMSKWRYGHFDEGFRNEVLNPLSSIEAAVALAERIGIADSRRIGIMGWSMGGFWTNLAVTYSHSFAAASSGEAARRDPVAYWTQGSKFDYFLDGIVGGPPVSANYDRWRQYAPSLRKPSVLTPVLFEYQGGDPAGLETFQSWAKQGSPVELVLYPDEGHVFSQPRHEFYSMQRNLDWFGFWLKGEEDSDLSKVEQYAHWHELRRKAQKSMN